MDGGMKAEVCAINAVSSVISWSQTIGNQSLPICKNQIRNLLNSTKTLILRGRLLSKHPPVQSFLGPRGDGLLWPVQA